MNHGPAVKSFVVTGSINACTTGSPEELSKGPLTNSTWLPITPDDARAQQNAYISYCSGKKEAELAIWEFLKTHSPSFTVTVFLPALIFGPPLEPLKGGVKGLHFSTSLIYNLFNGTNANIPSTVFPSCIDARDLADAHVKALTEPKVANKRLTIGGQGITFTQITHILAKLPELQGRLPAESGEDLKVTAANIDASEGNDALGMTFRTLEETIVDTAKKILELEGAF
jgi:nucleoside-diphosphate-sugar epimerase